MKINSRILQWRQISFRECSVGSTVYEDIARKAGRHKRGTRSGKPKASKAVSHSTLAVASAVASAVATFNMELFLEWIAKKMMYECSIRNARSLFLDYLRVSRATEPN
eukprot:330273_1